jgi:hypothetical protein
LFCLQLEVYAKSSDCSAPTVVVTLNGVSNSSTDFTINGSFTGHATNCSWSSISTFVLKFTGSGTINAAGTSNGLPNVSLQSGANNSYSFTGNWGPNNGSLISTGLFQINGTGLTTNNYSLQAQSLTVTNALGSTTVGLNLGSSSILITGGSNSQPTVTSFKYYKLQRKCWNLNITVLYNKLRFFKFNKRWGYLVYS